MGVERTSRGAKKLLHGVYGRRTEFHRGIVNEVKSVDDFDALLGQGADGLVVVEFYAKWCKKCIGLMPKYRKLATEFNTSSVCGKVDINAVGKLPRRQGIKEMPTFQFFHDGEKVQEIIGSLDSADVAEELRGVFREYAT